MPAGTSILLTPPGTAAIAVVRIRGDEVRRFLADHFSRAAKAGRSVHGDLCDGLRVIDDPVVVLHEDGQTADLSLHGGPWVVQSVFDLLQRSGFEVTHASDPPLPDVAVDADGDLGREVLTHLPLARTELALRVLLAQPSAWRALQARAREKQVSADELRRIASDQSLANLLRLPRVAVVGPPNVGKSTLANRLFAQERSITADLPGTTRDWVGGIANIDGLAVMLVDTPGQRTTDDTIEHRAITASREQIAAADLVLYVVDHTAAALATAPRESTSTPTILVRNKVDLAVDRTVAGVAMETVATTGQGIDTIRHAILSFFGCARLSDSEPRIWTDRQRAIVSAALNDPTALEDL